MRWPLHLCGTIHDLTFSVSWDRASLIDEVDRRVGKLCDLGLRPGNQVAIVHGNSAAFVADLLAVWSCGATAVLLDPASSETELSNLVSFIQPTIAISHSEGAAVPGVATHSLDGGARPRPEVSAGHSDELALLLITSGTTGMPKVVGLSHRALHNRLRNNRLAIGETAMASTLVSLPTSFGHGLIGNVLTPLFAGSDLVFPPRGTTLPHDLGRLIDAHQVTFLTSVPALWRMALKMSKQPANGSLRRVHVGSAPLSEQLWRDIIRWTGAETVNCYGLTEAANWFSGASSVNSEPRGGLVGRPWGGSAAILDRSGKIHLTGEGEVLIRSPSLMEGYLHRPDLTEQSRIDGFYRTGDLGFIDKDGQIVLQGRLKDEINRAGTKIQPAELDMLIEAHPAVEEACTFPVSDAIAGEIVAAAVHLKSGMTVTSESLTAWCRARIRRVAVPERWYFVSELPRSPRGKMRREEVYLKLLGERK